jgi:hypothetical protein
MQFSHLRILDWTLRMHSESQLTLLQLVQHMVLLPHPQCRDFGTKNITFHKQDQKQ